MEFTYQGTRGGRYCIGIASTQVLPCWLLRLISHGLYLEKLTKWMKILGSEVLSHRRVGVYVVIERCLGNYGIPPKEQLTQTDRV